MDTPKRRGRPPADDPATEVVKIRVTPSVLASYVAAAGNVPLAAWIRARLNAAAKRR